MNDKCQWRGTNTGKITLLVEKNCAFIHTHTYVRIFIFTKFLRIWYLLSLLEIIDNFLFDHSVSTKYKQHYGKLQSFIQLSKMNSFIDTWLTIYIYIHHTYEVTNIWKTFYKWHKWKFYLNVRFKSARVGFNCKLKSISLSVKQRHYGQNIYLILNVENRRKYET